MKGIVVNYLQWCTTFHTLLVPQKDVKNVDVNPLGKTIVSITFIRKIQKILSPMKIPEIITMNLHSMIQNIRKTLTFPTSTAILFNTISIHTDFWNVTIKLNKTVL